MQLLKDNTVALQALGPKLWVTTSGPGIQLTASSVNPLEDSGAHFLMTPDREW